MRLLNTPELTNSFIHWLVIPTIMAAVTPTSLFSAELVLDRQFVSIGDTIIISGTGFSSNEDVLLTETYFYESGEIAFQSQDRLVVASSAGSFEDSIPFVGEIFQTLVITALGLSSNQSASASVTSGNTLLLITSQPSNYVCFDTLSNASSVEVCADLFQICSDGSTVPLPGRLLYIYLNAGDCGADIGPEPNGTGITDANGSACLTLNGVDQLYLTGLIGYRVKFDGERAPDESEPPNSACDPNERVNMSAANDCFVITIQDSCDDAGSDYEIIIGNTADVYFLETIDLDRDNNTDIIYTGNTEEGLFIAYGISGSGLETPINYLPIKQAAIMADYINGDTLVDFIAVTLTQVYLFTNLGDRNFAIDSFPATSSDLLHLGGLDRTLAAPSFVAGYFNGDVFLDLVAAPDNIWFGDADGSYSSSTTLPFQFQTVNLCDFSNDGHHDLVVSESDSIKIYINDGLAGFSRSDAVFVGQTSVDLAPLSVVVDFDDDGNCDYAHVIPLLNDINQSMINIILGDGAGGIRQHDTIRVDGLAYDITVADVDRDGILDLIVANGTTQQLLVYFGDGLGGFDSTSFIDLQVTSDLTFALASLDLNRDGNYDFITGGLGGGTLLLAVNQESNDSILIDEMSVTAFSDVTLKVINPEGFVISETFTTVAGSEFQSLDVNGDETLDDRTMDYNLQLGEYTLIFDNEPDSPDPAPLTSAAIGINGSQQAIIFLDYDDAGLTKNEDRTPVDSLTFYYTVELVSSIQPPNGIPTDRSRPLFDWSLQVQDVPPGSIYHFQLDKYLDLRAPLFDVTDLTLPQYQPDASLGNDSVFYWRYQVFDGSGWSEFSRVFAVYITGVCCFGFTGNVDGDPEGTLDMADIIYLVEYLFLGGAAPPCPDASDVDGDPLSTIDISDVTYLVQYVFGNGPPPPLCP